jgi:ABC-type dipeptide/oligopeptide/nickel transport system ATPase component
VVAQIAARIAVMREGKLVETAAARQILLAPREKYTAELLAHAGAVQRVGYSYIRLGFSFPPYGDTFLPSGA